MSRKPELRPVDAWTEHAVLSLFRAVDHMAIEQFYQEKAPDDLPVGDPWSVWEDDGIYEPTLAAIEAEEDGATTNRSESCP